MYKVISYSIKLTELPRLSYREKIECLLKQNNPDSLPNAYSLFQLHNHPLALLKMFVLMNDNTPNLYTEATRNFIARTLTHYLNDLLPKQTPENPKLYTILKTIYKDNSPFISSFLTAQLFYFSLIKVLNLKNITINSTPQFSTQKTLSAIKKDLELYKYLVQKIYKNKLVIDLNYYPTGFSVPNRSIHTLLKRIELSRTTLQLNQLFPEDRKNLFTRGHLAKVKLWLKSIK